MDKNALRKSMIERIKSFPEKQNESIELVNLIQNSEEWKNASSILAFCPLSTEPDISLLLKDKRILLPYIENGEMKFSASRKLKRSLFGFMEPEHIEAEYDDALMLVPLIGFKGLYRLGRGAGFYDRYINEKRGKLHTAGVAFSVSFCPEFIPEKHDERLDRIFCLRINTET